MQSALHIGNLRFSTYGLIVAAGLIAALTFSQRTARLAGIAPESVWNAGLFALGAAFVFSRLLLIVVSPAALLHYPMLLLSLPSLTWTGIALTLFAVLVYTRVQKLPILRLLDAFAAPAMLLAAAVALAHLVEGSSPGMPTSVAWALPTRSLVGATQPLQIYAAAVALVLGGVALLALRRSPTVPGHTAALILALAGLAAFLLDMLAQPFDIRGTSWLDPGQFVALACLVAGLLLFAAAPQETA